MSPELHHSAIERLGLSSVHVAQIGGFHRQWRAGSLGSRAVQSGELGEGGAYVELGADDGLRRSSAYFGVVARFC
jgi:hypothetical protein